MSDIPAYPQAKVMWYAINEDLQHTSLTMPEQGERFYLNIGGEVENYERKILKRFSEPVEGRSHLRIERLGRRHDGIRFSCRADDKLTGERRQSTTVKLNIYFKPLGITTSNNKVCVFVLRRITLE